MGLSIHLQAVIPVDGETYRKHKAVVDACVAAGVSVPAESAAFFDDDNEEREVTEEGVHVSIGPYSIAAAVVGNVMHGDGARVYLSKLPAGTTHLRIFACT